MIDIQDKKDCCGCEACVQRCPKRCISLNEDREGFLYPKVDLSLCIHCNLCERVCPVIHQNPPREPLEVFAAKNPDETVRRESSSGGVFTLLAEAVIGRGGVVFGARFDGQCRVVHSYTETVEGLSAFRGSKYLQSHVGESFKDCESFLKQGREVLFSGTPCEIAGLRRFLRKDYEKLLLVDFICHGVPSPGVFRWYLKEQAARLTGAARQGGGKNTVSFSAKPLLPETQGFVPEGWRVEALSFRDKRIGWKKYSFVLSLSKATAAREKNTVSSSKSQAYGSSDAGRVELAEDLGTNLFMRGFLKDLYLRPSCHACPAKQLKSGSDLTLGDYWGIDSLMPAYDDDRGVSALTVNTEKGRAALHATNADLQAAPWEDLTAKNPALVKSAAVPERREAFFAEDGQTFERKIHRLCRKTMKQRVREHVYGIAHRLIGRRTRRLIKHLLGRNTE